MNEEDEDRIYTFEQEVWDEKECAKRAASAPQDHWGNRPPKGIIAYDGSCYPTYGRTMRYNGGTSINGEWYRGVRHLLPKIPDTYEFRYLISWGIIIVKRGGADSLRGDSLRPRSE